jgi:hypothetical protein
LERIAVLADEQGQPLPSIGDGVAAFLAAVQTIEEVSVQVTADAPDESNCPLAVEPATAAANRLPQG